MNDTLVHQQISAEIHNHVIFIATGKGGTLQMLHMKQPRVTDLRVVSSPHEAAGDDVRWTQQQNGLDVPLNQRGARSRSTAQTRTQKQASVYACEPAQQTQLRKTHSTS